MAIADARIPRWDVKVTTGQPVELAQRWFDRDARATIDLSGHTLRIWIGGSLDDVDDLTDAVEITPTIAGDGNEYATFSWNAGTDDRALRTTLDGRVVTMGWEKPSQTSRPANSGDANIFVNDGVVSSYVSVHIDAPGGGGGEGGGQVDSVVAGTGVSVNSTNPTAPIVALSAGTQTSLGLADSATQPADLGTAAAADTGDFDAAGSAAAAQAAAVQRANHTGTQAISTVTDLQTTLDGKAAVAAGVPTGGTIGQVLTKDSGTDLDVSWQDAAAGDSLPDQTGNGGEFLTTNGTVASWAPLPGGGDMAAAVYDPQAIADDAFDRANHTGAQAISTVTGLQAALDDKADISSLGTAAAADTGDFATAAQGGVADSAVQPADVGTTSIVLCTSADQARPTGVDTVLWVLDDPEMDLPENAAVGDHVEIPPWVGEEGDLPVSRVAGRFYLTIADA